MKRFTGHRADRRLSRAAIPVVRLGAILAPLTLGLVEACAGVPEPPPAPPPPGAPTVARSPAHDASVPHAITEPRALAPVVHLEPETPEEGTLVTLIVEPAPAGLPVIDLAGRAGSAELAFIRLDGGVYLGFAPAPVGAGELEISARATLADGSRHTVERRARIAPRRFRSSRLSVDPRFTRPDPRHLDRIREEIELARAVRRIITPRPLWEGRFIHPRPGRVTSRFGQRRLFNGELRSRHWGLDIHADIGDPIFAANSGRVALAQDHYMTGNTVYLDHGLGLYTAYFHMSELDVWEGQWVGKGTVLGRAGATGRVTGPHLHWGLYLYGVPLDPLSVFESSVMTMTELTLSDVGLSTR